MVTEGTVQVCFYFIFTGFMFSVFPRMWKSIWRLRLAFPTMFSWYYVCDIGKYSKTPTFQFVTHQCNFRYVQISGFLFVMFLFYFSGDMNSWIKDVLNDVFPPAHVALFLATVKLFKKCPTFICLLKKLQVQKIGGGWEQQQDQCDSNHVINIMFS